MQEPGVLESELQVPRILGTSVTRKRRLDAIAGHEAAGRTIFVVSAPAGAGKTTLLGQWAARVGDAGEPVAWLSLDGDDNDAFRFWSRVLAACSLGYNATRSGVVSALAELKPPSEAAESAFLASLTAALASADQPVWLVFDDAHKLVDEHVLDGLARLLHSAPPTVRIVLSGRHDLPLPVPRMVVEGTAVELRAADLAFDPDETRDLLNSRGVETGAGDIDVLLDRTDGWAVGIELAAARLTRAPDVRASIKNFSGRDQAVADYLVSEVLCEQPDDIRAFLRATAVPEHVTAALARELTGRVDAGAVLERLWRENILTLGHATPRQYRHHTLLRSYLLAELNRRDATAARHSHTALADWYATHDAPALALEHAVAVNDWTRVSDLIDRQGPRLITTGDRFALSRALASAPRSVLARSSTGLVAAMVALQDGNLTAARAHLDRIGDDPSTQADPRHRLLHVAALLHEARLCGDRSPRVFDLIEQSHAQATDDTDVDLLVNAGRGMMRIAVGDLTAAEPELTSVHRLAGKLTRDRLALECLSYLSLSAAMRGDLVRMAARAQQAIDFAAARRWASESPMVHCYTVAAWLAWQRMEARDAESHLSHAEQTGAAVEPPTRLSMRILRAHKEYDQAGEVRALVERISRAWAGTDEHLVPPSTVAHYCVADLRVALATQQRGWADETLMRARRLLGDEAGDVSVLDAMMHSDRGHDIAARQLLAPVLIGESTCHVVTAEISAWLLEAQLADGCNEPVRAHQALVRAIGLAARVGEVRTVATAPEQVQRLLIRANGRFGVHDGFVDKVFAAKRDAVGGPEPTAAGALLTRREFELLRHLPSSMSLEEIANANTVSVNTTKTHLKGLYKKLKAGTRREAVERGRKLGVL